MSRDQIPPGTLIMLILSLLAREEKLHAYGIAERIKVLSEGVLEVSDGSLYPTLQQMLESRWLKCGWSFTKNNRRARYYRLTAAGRRQLQIQISQVARVTEAIAKITQIKKGNRLADASLNS